MKEIKAIIKAYNELDKATQQAALATVVRVEGSSYRRTGARMLVMDNGTWIGGISGGCLEGDALKRARLAINSSRPTLITYDTSEDDPHQIGVGLGCNGIIDVLFCPLDFDDPQNQIYPMPLYTSDKNDVYVGRLRKDESAPRCYNFWCVGDQIRKGAALNTMQIAEVMIKNGWL